MGRNINPGIPKDTREWPTNERKQYPKWLGKSKIDGSDVIAKVAEEEEELKRQHGLAPGVAADDNGQPETAEDTGESRLAPAKPGRKK